MLAGGEEAGIVTTEAPLVAAAHPMCKCRPAKCPRSKKTAKCVTMTNDESSRALSQTWLPTFRHGGHGAVRRGGVSAGKAPGGALAQRWGPESSSRAAPSPVGPTGSSLCVSPADGHQDCHLPITGASRANRSLVARCRKAPNKDLELFPLSGGDPPEATLFADLLSLDNLLDSVSRSESSELTVQTPLRP